GPSGSSRTVNARGGRGRDAKLHAVTHPSSRTCFNRSTTPDSETAAHQVVEEMIEDRSSRSGSGAGTQSLCGRTALARFEKNPYRYGRDPRAAGPCSLQEVHRLGRAQPSAPGGLAEAGRMLEMADVRVLV